MNEKEYQYYGVPQIDKIFKDGLRNFNIESNRHECTAHQISDNLRVFANTCEQKLKDLGIDTKYVKRDYVEFYICDTRRPKKYYNPFPFEEAGSQVKARRNAKIIAKYYTLYKQEAEDEDFMAMYESAQEFAQKVGARPY